MCLLKSLMWQVHKYRLRLGIRWRSLVRQESWVWTTNREYILFSVEKNFSYSLLFDGFQCKEHKKISKELIWYIAGMIHICIIIDTSVVFAIRLSTAGKNHNPKRGKCLIITACRYCLFRKFGRDWSVRRKVCGRDAKQSCLFPSIVFW